eukprot:SM000035S13042  [mRNA]  locus=s35:24263:31753:+ [translate_table: standard]
MAGVRSRALFYGALLALALVASAPSGCSAARAVLEAAAAAPPTAENVTANAPAKASVKPPTNGSRDSAYANAGGFRTGFYINCGGRNVSNVGNITWQADAYFIGGETFSNTLAVVQNTTAAYNSPLLYQSLRYFGGEDLPINAYSIPVNESGYYWVRLHFAEILYKEASLRVFNVSIEGSPSLISFHLNASNMVVVKEFFVPVSDTVLDIQFVRGPVGDPMISAIEVTMAPTGMYDLEATSDTVLATEFRLDCGGNQPFLDQGGRMWLPDTGTNAPANSNNTYIWTSYFNSENLVPGTDVTPDLLPLHIYQSQRVLANIERLGLHALAANQSVDLRKHYRDPLIYNFVVDPLAKYFIRLHQVESNLPWAGARIMNITINQQLAVANLDVYKEVGLDSPYIVDLLVSATPSGLLVLNITAAVTDYTNDPMIAGVELFKVLTTGPLLRNYTPQSGADGIWKSLAITLMCLLGLGVLVAAGLLLLPLALKQRVSDPNNFKGTQSDSQFFNGLLGGASTAGNSRDHSSMQHSGAGGSTSGIQSRGSVHLSAHGTQIFPLEELKEATNNFSRDNILGQGGFGQVFKATLWSGQIAAVKRLDLFSQQGEREFLTEVELLSRLHHKNLVSLIGYCDETSQLMLVYEYIPCGTLRDHLRLPEKAAQLDWPARLKISVGAARGLEYLHRGASPSVIHRDIKTSNIILDVDHEAKVTDFGLSKLGRNAAMQTHISTNVKGTLGYLDPNYYAKQHLTEKSDVYSFGVVMLELLTGRMPIWQHDDDSYDDEKLCNLVEWATDHLKRDDVASILAPQLAEAVQYDESIRQFAQLAWNMTEHQSKLRPNMGEVLRRLERAAQLAADSAALLPPTAAVSTAATGTALNSAVAPLDSSLQSILSLDALSLPAVPEQPEAQDETATINSTVVAAKVSPRKDASPDRRALAPPAKAVALPAKHIAAAPFATPLPSVTNWTPLAATKPPRILLPAGAFPSGAI